MKAHKIQISTLHTGSAAPVYQKLGWRSVARWYMMQTAKEILDSPTLLPEASQTIRDADLQSDEEIQRLMKLHAAYASRFNGPFVRDDPEYWRRWVRVETDHFVILQDAHGDIIAWMGLRSHKKDKSKIVVQDFGVRESEFESDRGHRSFQILIKHLLERMRNEVGDHHQILASAAQFQNTTENNIDEGTMYLILDDQLQSRDLLRMFHGTDSPSPNTSHHLFLPVDDF
eukprot:TRINITY_DN7411_c0_g1_i1.p1 TRINITY_DN7411_c0_g1~~TRINITY_DN7411_c0_g1_i1.p1  ORF type:complete len:229 (+),score=54.09 TRINITY_DN7411_c0_g1_i1:364-1050(+)